MLLPESLFRLFEWDRFTPLGLFHAVADGRDGLCAFETVEHELVALGILDDEFSAAVYGQNERCLLFPLVVRCIP